MNIKYDSKLCDQECSILDCRNHGCVNREIEESLIVIYSHYEIPVDIGMADLEILASEISVDKKIDKQEVIDNITDKLNELKGWKKPHQVYA